MEKFNWTVKGGKFVHVQYISGRAVKTRYKNGDTFVAHEYEISDAFRDIVVKGERVFSPEDLKAEIPKVSPNEVPKPIITENIVKEPENKEIDENIPSVSDDKKKVEVKRPYTRRSKRE